MKKTILICFCSSLTGLSLAVTHVVTTAAEFNALPTLNAGDHVIMMDGTYGALNKTLTSSIADDATATNNPVLVYAETPGGVDINALSQITLSGRGITLAGLDFVSGSGMIDNGSGSATYLIRTDTNSRYMTLSNLRMKDCTSGDDYGYWVFLRGFNNVIEYCSFEGKDEPIRNTVIAITRHSSEAGVSTPRNHIIRRNYFGPRECSTSQNGYETIRIGDSSSQAHSMSVTVEENVFYRSVWRTDGSKPNDMEIISNKSADNVFRNNTFLESFGQLTLRHGDRALIEGNYFFGGGYYSGSSILIGSSNSHQSGVRIIGEDHIVRNNFFQNLQGTGLRSALCLMGGESGFDEGDGSYGDNGYEAADRAQIHHNTFVDCKQITLGYYGSGGNTQPVNCDIYNNAWQGSGSSDAVDRPNGFNVGTSGGNYFYMPGGDYGWTGLSGTYTSSSSPDITESYDNYLIPAAGSPLLDLAAGSALVSDDIRGLARPGSNVDIGSFEREVTGAGFGPLLRSEVGPEFDGGPSGTYPGGTNQYDLIVASPYGTPTPPVGTNTYGDVLINASMAGSPLVSGGTQEVVTGWIGTGDVITGTGSNTSFTMTQHSTLTWLWKSQYLLSTGISGNGIVDVDENTWVDINSNITVTAMPNLGYDFLNWSGDVSSTNPVIVVTMDAAKTITANFTGPVSLDVTSPYGTPTPAVGSASYTYGTLINATMTGSPEVSGTTRHVVTGWTGTGDVGAGSGSGTSFTLTQNSILDWQWQTQYWLDTEVSGSGTVDVADAWFNAGTNVTVTATPLAGNHFVNWSGASGSTDPVLNLTMNEAKSLSAVFAPGPAPIETNLAVSSVYASSDDGNSPTNTLDKNLLTRWSANGVGESITYDLGIPQSIREIKLAWYKGDERTANFDIRISDDASNWTLITNMNSSGTTLQLEDIDIPDTEGRYVRIIGYGNSSPSSWNSITETEIWGVQTVVYIPSPELPGGGVVEFTVPNSISGVLYQLESTDDLVFPSWGSIGLPVAGTGGDITLTDPGPLTTNRYYRMTIQP